MITLTDDEIRRCVARWATADGVIRVGPRAALQAWYGALALEEDRQCG